MGKMLVFVHTITSGVILYGLIFNQARIIQSIFYPNFENI